MVCDSRSGSRAAGINMYSILTFLTVAGTLWTVDCEIHSLTQIDIAFSKPVNLPGIHEFTLMELLDDRMINYYDSSHKKLVPKQPWMERMEKDYWDRESQIRQNTEEWYKANIRIAMDRMRHSNDTGLHIVQHRIVCTAETQAGDDKSLKFISGREEYSYDGDDFLVFDLMNKRWIAPVDTAVITTQRWNEDKIKIDYDQHYLEKECVDLLSKFVDYGQDQLKNSPPPELHVYDKKNKNPDFINLHCMATGFLFKGVTLNIMRDGKVVDHLDGLKTTGVRPNCDGTYQIMNQVEILRSDSARFTCEVIHPASNMHKVKDWDSDDGPNIGVIAGVSAAVVVMVGVLVAVIIYMKNKETKKKSSNVSDSGSTGSSRVSAQDSSGSTQPQPDAPLLGETQEAVPSAPTV